MTTAPRADTDGFGLVASLWRGVDVFRVASLVYAVVAYATRYELYRHPAAGWAVLAAMAAWTAVVWFWPSRPTPLVLADMAVSFAAVMATRVVDDPVRIGEGASTLPLTWPAASVLAFAIWKGWVGGVVGALVIGLADVLVVNPVNAGTIHNIVLLLLAGAVVGYSADLYRRSQAALARALQVEAVTRERERLARDIHDSVLQVLAYVQRRGAEIGGESASLGRMAGEQEERLRTLVSSRVGPQSSHSVDLRRLLGEHGGSGVHVSAPASPVGLPYDTAADLSAAVGAALDNVREHAGAGAQAWVLVEDDGDEVVVTVRDDGVGIAPGRLEEAEQDGRLGVASSVRGRVADHGGTTSVVSSPGDGTEVELRVPRSP
ncbi:MAG TPA: DUF5931 domain-containing protein [Actinomycetales bacterium]|nr:DUF5931 domain-containing protein [Actinomycetales bacterium]